MKCKECGSTFNGEKNKVTRIDGTKTTVFPNCGSNEIDEKIP